MVSAVNSIPGRVGLRQDFLQGTQQVKDVHVIGKHFPERLDLFGLRWNICLHSLS